MGNRQRQGQAKPVESKNSMHETQGKDIGTFDTKDKDELAQTNTHRWVTNEEQVKLIGTGQVIMKAGNTPGQKVKCLKREERWRTQNKPGNVQTQ